MSPLRDCTTLVEWGRPEGDELPLLRCACGATFEEWRGPVLNMEDPEECPACGRLLVWRARVDIYELI